MNTNDISSSELKQQSKPVGLAHTVRPTLLAAVGGTGVAAAKHALASMEELLGTRDKCNFFAVCAFDADVQSNTEPRLITNAEFVYLGDFNVPALFEAIVSQDEYSYWRDWLPPRLSAQQVSGGVGGVRPKGRLCYCYRRDVVRDTIQAALAKILQSGYAARQLYESHDINVDVSSGIDIHIVSSVCGGTGAGMFLDFAYDVRRWARQLTEGDVIVTGHLVLPGAFTGKPALHSLLMANAYAALQELDRFMRADPRDPWRMRYSLSQEVQDNFAPFDICYLLDGLGRGGLSDIDDLTAMIGEAVALFTLSEIGTKLKGRIRNVIDSRLTVEDHRDRPCCYSSYGLITMEAPKQLIAEYISIDLAKTLREQLAAIPTPQAIEAINKRIDTVEKPLGEKSSNFSTIDLPTPSEELARIIEDASYDLNSAEIRFEAETKKLEESYSSTIDSRFQTDIQFVDELQDYVRHQLKELVTLGGTSSCRRYLAELHVRLNQHKQGLAEETRRLTMEASQQTEKGEKNLSRRLDLWTKGAKARQVAKLLRRQERSVEQLQIRIENFSKAWGEFAGLANQIELDININEERYYKNRNTRVAAASLDFFTTKISEVKKGLIAKILEQMALNIDHWRGRGALEMRQEVVRLCKKVWSEHRDKSMELDCEILFCDSHSQQAHKLDERLSLIMTHASPLWEIDEAYPLAGNRFEISCIGASATSRLYLALSESNQGRLECSEEQRPDLVPLLRTEHGISLIGLRRLKSYWEAFIRTISEEQRWDFQFFNDCRWITEMEFADEDESYQQPFRLFSLLEMASVISRKVGEGYVQVNGQDEQLLGRTRSQAFSTLKDNGGLRRLEQDFSKLIKEAERDKDRIKKHIEDLKRRIKEGLERDERREINLPGGALKREVFQLHNEIRALRKLLKEIEIGL